MLLTVGRDHIPGCCVIPTIGAPDMPPIDVSAEAGTAPRSASDSHCGCSTALAIGVADAQACGADSPPIGAAWPIPASTGRSTASDTHDWVAALAPPAARPAASASSSAILGRSCAWIPARYAPVRKLPPLVAVRLKAALRFAGPARVLKLLKAERIDDVGSVAADDDPVAARLSSCLGTLAISCDSIDWAVVETELPAAWDPAAA